MDVAAQTELERLRAKVRSLEEQLSRSPSPVGGPANASAEARYRALFAATQDGLLVIDDDGRYVQVNEAYARLLKSDPALLVGRHFSEFIPPDRLAEAEASFATLTTQGQGLPEFPLRAVDGTVIDCEWTVRAHFLPGLSLCSARAITAQKRTEQALRESEARFRFLSELDDAIRPLTDPGEIVTTAVRFLSEYLRVDNVAYCHFEADQNGFQILGDYARPGAPRLVGPYTLDQFGEPCAEALTTNRPHVADRPRRVSDSLNLPVHDVCPPAGIPADVVVPLHQAGRLVAAVSIYQLAPRHWQPSELDLLEQVATRCWESIERTRMTRELQEREKRYRFLAESIPQMVWTATPDGNLDYVSAQVTRYFGTTPESVLGSGWLQWVHPEDQAPGVARWQHSLATGEPYETALRLRRSGDGQWRWHLVRALALADPEGRIVQWFGTCTDFEDQRQAESQLRQANNRLEGALAAAELGLWTWDVTGEKLIADRNVALLFDLDEQTVAGGLPPEHFLQRIHPDDQPRVREEIAEAVERAGTYRVEYRVRGADGSERWVASRGRAKTDAQGRHWLNGVVLDITDRQRATVALEQAEHNSRTILNSISDGFFAIDREWRFTFVNRAAEVILTRQASELVGALLWERYPGLIGSPFEPVCRQAMAQGQTGQIVAYYPDHDRFYEAVVYPFTEGISIYFRNVTEQQRAGEIQRKTEAALRDSEARYRVLIESLPQLVWTCLPDGRCDYLSSQWVAYTGVPETDQLDLNWLDRVIHPEDRDRTREHWLGAVAGRHSYEIEYRIRAADGTYRWFQTRGLALRDSQGTIVRWFGTCTDIDDRRRAEGELRAANRELEEFAYVASHDLQEPLRMVNIYTQQILRRLDTQNPEITEFASYVHGGVARMQTLIADLLTYSRTVQREELPVGSADLSAALREAVSVLQTSIAETRAVIYTEPLPLVKGDTSQLAHVFQNLLSNALKYRRPEEAPEIRIAAVANGPQWIVSVRDNGIGFDPQYAARIFGLFKRLHKDEYPGTGLGLAICERIVERYGGRIWAEGRPGQGATFFFALRARDEGL